MLCPRGGAILSETKISQAKFNHIQNYAKLAIHPYRLEKGISNATRIHSYMLYIRHEIE